MSMNQWAVRTVAGAAMVLASMAFGSANATTGTAAGMFSQLTGGASEVAATTPALAQTLMADLVINATGVASFDGPAAAGNTLLTFNATPGALVDALTFNLSLATVGESWQSEATIAVFNSDGAGVAFSPGAGFDEPGSGTFSGAYLLSEFGLAFNVLSDGVLFVEFYESYDDVAGAADANWTAGGVTLANVGVVPEPGTYGLMALGMLAVVGAARRRKA